MSADKITLMTERAQRDLTAAEEAPSKAQAIVDLLQRRCAACAGGASSPAAPCSTYARSSDVLLARAGSADGDV